MIKHAEIELSALTKRGCVNVLKKEKRMILICNLPTRTNGNITAAAVINYEIDGALPRFFKFIISGLNFIKFIASFQLHSRFYVFYVIEDLCSFLSELVPI